MATIVKTESGNWKGIVRRKGWPTTSKTFRLRHDAVDWARHVEDGMVYNTYVHRPLAEKLLFSDAMERYLREVTPLKSPRTQVAEHYRALKLKTYFGDYALTAIPSDLVARFRDQRLATRKQSNKRMPSDQAPLLDPATVRLDISLLSHVFTIAIREWNIGLSTNPVTNIRWPNHSECRTRRLLPGEEQQLLTAFSNYVNPMLKLIFQLALETAMRAGEIRSLEVSQINFDRRTVFLSDTKNGCSRTVPLTMKATQCLREAITEYPRPKGCEYIFYGGQRSDGQYGCYRFENAWWKLRDAVGITGLRFHDLRHEAISRFVEAGFGDLEVAAISGHKSMQMLKRYTHLRAEQLVQKLDRLMGSKKGVGIHR